MTRLCSEAVAALSLIKSRIWHSMTFRAKRWTRFIQTHNCRTPVSRTMGRLFSSDVGARDCLAIDFRSAVWLFSCAAFVQFAKRGARAVFLGMPTLYLCTDLLVYLLRVLWAQLPRFRSLVMLYWFPHNNSQWMNPEWRSERSFLPYFSADLFWCLANR